MVGYSLAITIAIGAIGMLIAFRSTYGAYRTHYEMMQAVPDLTARATMWLFEWWASIKWTGLLCFAAVAAAVIAQETPVLRVNTRLVEVDVVVHSKGACRRGSESGRFHGSR